MTDVSSLLGGMDGEALEGCGSCEPPAKHPRTEGKASGRKSIGSPGVPLNDAHNLSSKVFNKTCQYCGRKCSDVDELDSDRTTSWYKPHHQGRICLSLGIWSGRLECVCCLHSTI